MREIAFRAKNTKNGLWFYGTNMIDGDVIKSAKDYCLNLSDFWDLVGVGILDTKTVGQFIGRKDKNGKELYENDLIKAKLWKNKIGFSYGKIVWFDDAGFRIEWFSGVPSYGQYENIEDEFEKIGNCHDNPELLEAQK